MNSWINGRTGNTILIDDRGLLYGDGAFETMRVRRRAVRFLEYHLERIAEGCRRLDIEAPDQDRLRGEIARAAALKADGVLKLIITRGRGLRGYRPSGRERCTRVMSLHPLSPAARAAPRPARVRLCAMRLGSNEKLAGLKTLNRLESVLARAEWTDARIWEGLMRDIDDHIVCGTMSNIFLRRGTTLVTPKVDRCGIAGVMRRWVLGQAPGLALAATEGRLRWEDLAAADEVFMTNAVVGVVPVAVIQHGRAALRPAQRQTADALRGILERQ